MERLGRTTLPWESTLSDLRVEEIRHLAVQAEELAQHPAWKWIEQAGREWIARLNDSLMPAAKIPEHERYVSATSQIFGMRLVLDCPEAIRLLAQRAEEKERVAAELAARKEQR